MTIDETIQAYLTAFDNRRQYLEKDRRAVPMAPWLAELRGSAAEALAEVRFPDRRNEDWKYTSSATLLELPVAPGPASSSDAELSDQQRDDATCALSELDSMIDGPTVVLVDGHYSEELSSGLDDAAPRGLSVTPLNCALSEQTNGVSNRFGRQLDFSAHGFVAANTLFADEGVVVEVDKNSTIDIPLHIVCLRTSLVPAVADHVRYIVTLGENAEATVVEHYVSIGESVYLTNAAAEISLAAGARLNHVKIQVESPKASHVARIEVEGDRDSRYASTSIAIGAALSRTEINVALNAEGATTVLDGLYAVGRSQHVDHHTVVEHKSPRTESRELYKGALGDKAHGVFTGRVLVERDAQEIEAHQSNKNLLLSDQAVIDTRPQLEIYADDVKCSHGATVGRLDDNQMFYLRQRGIDRAEATRLLTYAFASEIVAAISNDTLREGVQSLVLEQMESIVDRGERR